MVNIMAEVGTWPVLEAKAILLLAGDWWTLPRQNPERLFLATKEKLWSQKSQSDAAWRLLNSRFTVQSSRG
jgi:hypothetical protein